MLDILPTTYSQKLSTASSKCLLLRSADPRSAFASLLISLPQSNLSAHPQSCHAYPLANPPTREETTRTLTTSSLSSTCQRHHTKLTTSIQTSPSDPSELPLSTHP